MEKNLSNKLAFMIFLKVFIISFVCFFIIGLFAFGDDLSLGFIIVMSGIIGFIAQKNEENINKRVVFGHRKDWRELRRKVLERDRYRCSECKKVFSHNKSKLHVHYIIERFQGGEDNLDNLTCLCESCHGKIHKDGNKPMYANAKKRIIESTITNNGMLHFDYRAESLGGIGTNSTRKVKPERFYSQNGHYYMYGFCYLDNDFRYFRASRILKFHEEK